MTEKSVTHKFRLKEKTKQKITSLKKQSKIN